MYEEEKHLPDDEYWDCPTCLRPMPPEKDHYCSSCGGLASHHITVTSMCKLMRSVLDRENCLKAELNRLHRLIDKALTDYNLGGEIGPDTFEALAIAVEGRDA